MYSETNRPAHPDAGPCGGFAMNIRYQDVAPDVLESESAVEAAPAGSRAPDAYLRRVLPALERQAPDEMAEALLDAGQGAHAARAHADRMRRQAVAAGTIHRARFWADVAEAIRVVNA